MFKCERCGYFTEYKSNLKNHFNRKNPCKPILSNISIATLKLKINEKLIKNENVSILSAECQPNVSILSAERQPSVSILSAECQPNVSICQPSVSIDSDFHTSEKKISRTNLKKNLQCEYCEKIFKHRQSKHRHMKTCKLKHLHKSDYMMQQHGGNVQLIEHMSNQIIELKNEKQAMKKSMEKLLDKVGNVTHITNHQQNVYINNYGQENLEYITGNYLQKLLQLPYSALPKLIKDIYFHPEHPENRNVKITNKKLPYVSVYKGNKWVLHDKNQVIENMVDKGFTIIDTEYGNIKDKMHYSKKKNYSDFQKRFESQDKKLHKELKKNTEMLVLNNS